jgi:hypothetical protein
MAMAWQGAGVPGPPRGPGGAGRAKRRLRPCEWTACVSALLSRGHVREPRPRPGAPQLGALLGRRNAPGSTPLTTIATAGQGAAFPLPRCPGDNRVRGQAPQFGALLWRPNALGSAPLTTMAIAWQLC